LGALGAALTMQGHEVIFAARRPEIINSINRRGYDVVVKGSMETRIEVRGVRGVLMPGEEFAREVERADHIYTWVRPDNLPEFSVSLAEAFRHRI
jgi:hypothetical protein